MYTAGQLGYSQIYLALRRGERVVELLVPLPAAHSAVAATADGGSCLEVVAQVTRAAVRLRVAPATPGALTGALNGAAATAAVERALAALATLPDRSGPDAGAGGHAPRPVHAAGSRPQPANAGPVVDAAAPAPAATEPAPASPFERTVALGSDGAPDDAALSAAIADGVRTDGVCNAIVSAASDVPWRTQLAVYEVVGARTRVTPSMGTTN